MRLRTETPPGRGRWMVLLLYLVMIIGVAVAWRDPDLRERLQPQAIAASAQQFLAHPLAFAGVLLGYVLAAIMGIPSGIMATVGILLFGPWPGMLYVWSGMLLGAVVVYAMGRYAGASLVQRWEANPRIHAVAKVLQRDGFWAVFLVRALPLAPFVLVNLSAGAFRIRFVHYVMGTALGLVPLTVTVGLFMDRLKAALQSPNWVSYSALAVVVVLVIAGVMWFKRRIRLPE